MTEDIDALAARLTLHDFLLEIIIADHYATLPDSAQALTQLRGQIVNRIALLSQGRGEPARIASVRSQATRDAEAFFDKTAKRVEEIIRPGGR